MAERWQDEHFGNCPQCGYNEGYLSEGHPAALLHLDPRDRAGLEWIRNRARFWLTGLKRRRKYLPRGTPYSEAEAAAIRALAALEEAAGRLLGQVDQPEAGQQST